MKNVGLALLIVSVLCYVYVLHQCFRVFKSLKNHEKLEKVTVKDIEKSANVSFKFSTGLIICATVIATVGEILFKYIS